MILGFICLMIGFNLGVGCMAILSIAKDKSQNSDNLSARKEGENDVRIS